jgi:hypothetical protein
MKLVGPFLLTPEQGARTSVHLASSAELEGVSGRYFYRQRPIRSRSASSDVESARRLWELSERIADRSSGRQDGGR